MPSIGQALLALDDALFVGRVAEKRKFEAWLEASPPGPPILNVTGPGGVGKSTLLRAFARLAAQRGRPTLVIDGSEVSETPAALLRAMGGDTPEDVVARLDARKPLVVLDTFEDLLELSPYLREEILARLDLGIKVVIAGRLPLRLAWRRDSVWQNLIHTIALSGFAPDESRTYLQRRGIDEALVEQVLNATRGSPLALALAADLVLEFGARRLDSTPQWHLLVRSLVERLLRDVRDWQLRELLEACTVVRHFDETTLAAISGHESVGRAFARLCRLSVVQPAEHGLTLHDDMRRALATDLSWRSPQRHAELRERALAFYRTRSRTASADERSWMFAERLFLLNDAFLREYLFGDADRDPLWLEPGRPEDVPELRRVWRETLRGYPPDIDFSLGGKFDQITALELILAHPATRVRVVRGRDGAALGFNTTVSVCQASISLLDHDAVHAPLIRAFFGPTPQAALPATPEASQIWYLDRSGWTETQSEAVRAILLRDQFSMLARGGVYLCSAVHPMGKTFLEGMGFVRVPEARSWTHGQAHPVDGYVLDLSRIGVEPWIDALLSGRQPPRALPREELERELHTVLLHWHEDAHLASSPLLSLSDFAGDPTEASTPALLRTFIEERLQQVRAASSPAEKLAVAALELAYLKPGLSHERVAEQLAVSRATLYRLLKRGLTRLVDVLEAAPKR